MNYWINQLREKKNWDFVTIYQRDSPPFNLPREAKYFYDATAGTIDIPTEAVMPAGPPEPGKPREMVMMTSVIIDISEIIRLEFYHKVQPVGPEVAKKPGIIMP